MSDLLENLGIGLSRLLRYSYGGFLLIGLLTVVKAPILEQATDAIGWELVALTALVLGAGIYAVHRTVIVPVHHALLCLFWWIAEARQKKEDSSNPTRWLGSLKVPLLWRIPAYTILRRSELFRNHADDWNVAHAESGLVLITAEGFFLAWLYTRSQNPPPANPTLLFWASTVLLAFSLGGFVQHAVECLYFRQKTTEVKEELKKLGLIRS